MDNSKLVAVAVGIMAAFIMAVCSGCGMTTGWEVKFGVNPITSINDHKTLGSVEQLRATYGR